MGGGGEDSSEGKDCYLEDVYGFTEIRSQVAFIQAAVWIDLTR